MVEDKINKKKQNIQYCTEVQYCTKKHTHINENIQLKQIKVFRSAYTSNTIYGCI